MINPIISVIMPAYNSQNYIAEAIESVLNQTFTDFEFIIINDGSVDNTEEIILSYNDSRIKYIRNDHNLKLIKSLNIGIDLANGKYISRMDSDDILFPNLFESQLEIFKKFNVDIVNVLTYHLSEDGKKIWPDLSRPAICSSALSFVNVFQNMLTHPGIMVRSFLMKKFKYLDKSLILHFEDAEIWNRMFASGIICYTIPKRLLYYRISSNSINFLFEKERNKRLILYKKEYILNRYNYIFDKEFWVALSEPKKFSDIDIIKKELYKFFSFIESQYCIDTITKKHINFWIVNYLLFLNKSMYKNNGSFWLALRIGLKIIINLDLFRYIRYKCERYLDIIKQNEFLS